MCPSDCQTAVHARLHSSLGGGGLLGLERGLQDAAACGVGRALWRHQAQQLEDPRLEWELRRFDGVKGRPTRHLPSVRRHTLGSASLSSFRPLPRSPIRAVRGVRDGVAAASPLAACA